MLGSLVALPRRPDEPFQGLLLILFHSPSGLVAQTEVTLRGRTFLLGRRAVPFDRLREVLRHDLAGFVKNAQIELRRRITAFRCFPVPF